MIDPHEPIVSYLAELEREAASLPADVRAELLADVRAHLDEVAHRDQGPAALHQAIDDLGSPGTVVAAAREELGPTIEQHRAGTSGSPTAATMPRVPGIGREVAAFALAVPGPVVALVIARSLGGAVGASPALLILPPLFTLLAGWALVWTSRWWPSSDKAVATALWPFGFALPILAFSVPTQRCVTDDGSGQVVCDGFALHPALGIALLLVLVAIPLAGTGWLFARAQRGARVAAPPPPSMTPIPR